MSGYSLTSIGFDKEMQKQHGRHTMETKEYVVDVFIPIAIRVSALDADMAESMAEDKLNESTIRARIDAVVNDDIDTDFVTSDSAPQFEVGEG